MSKLFKNIGNLEDRLLPTINTVIPPVEQGSLSVKAFKYKPVQGDILPNKFNPTIFQGEGLVKVSLPVKSDIINQLKTIGDTQEKNIAALQIRPTQGIDLDSVPLKYSFFLKPNANIQQQSSILLNFPNRISLEDRLKQSGLGTTQHLAQYFLSDVYANYIKITPFTFTGNQGSTTIGPYQFEPVQGGTNPILFSTPAINGGITPTLPIQDVQILQGIVISNNQTYSFISLTGFNPIISQGETTITPFLYNPNQGSAVIASIQYTPNQGSTTVGSFDYIPIQGSTSTGIFNYIPIQGETTVGAFVYVPVQGGLLPQPITEDPSQGETTPQIVGYEVDKLLSILTPLLKHGTVPIDTTTWQSIIINQGLKSSTEYDVEIQKIDAANNTYKDRKNNIGINPDGTFRSLDVPNPITTLNLEESEFIQNFIIPQVSFPANNAASNLTKYATLDYSNIARRSSKPKTEETTDFRQDITQETPAPFHNGQNYTNSNVYKRLGLGNYGKGGVDRSDFTKDLGLSDSLYDSVEKTGNDLVKLKFISVRDNTVLQFRSYIKAFSEDYGVDYTDVEYIGRPDKLKLYKGNNRGGSLSFIVPAGTRKEVRVMHQKLNRLAQITYGAQYSEDAAYFVAPFVKLTVGDYYRNMPINITSLKYDTNPTEYPWEINIRPDGKVGDLFEGPQFIDVQVSFNVIGHNLPLSNFDVIDTPNFRPSTGQNIPI